MLLSNMKRIALRNSTANLIGFVFPTFLKLLATPYILHKLGVELYGVYIIVLSFAGFFALMEFGFGQSIIKYVSEYKDRADSLNKIINTGLVVMFIIGIAGSLSIYLLAHYIVIVLKIPKNYEDLCILVFKLASMGFLLNMMTSVFMNISKAFLRYDINAGISVSIGTLTTLSIVGILYLEFSLKEVIMINIFYSFISMIVYFIFSKRLIRKLKITFKIDKRLLKKLYSYSIYVGINQISGSVVFKLDKFIVGYFLGISSVTYYAIPFMIATMIHGLISSVTQFTFPLVSTLTSSADKERIRGIFTRGLRYIVFLSAIIIVPAVVLGDSFISIWMGKEFAENSRGILSILMITFYFSAVGVLPFWFYNGLDKPNINMVNSVVGSSFYLIGATVLTPIFGIKGIAASLFLGLIPFPWYYYVLSKILNLNCLSIWLTMLKGFSIVFLGFFLVQFIPDLFQSYTRLVIIGATTVAVSVMLSILVRIINIEDLKIWLRV